jgi:hypothetical protein
VLTGDAAYVMPTGEVKSLTYISFGLGFTWRFGELER